MGKHAVLRGYGLFRLVLARGEKVYGRFLRASYLIGESEKCGIRVGVSVPKSSGSAVMRNRVKRLIRESVRRQYGRLNDCPVAASARVDIVFQFHHRVSLPLKRITLRDVAPDIETICTTIIEKLSKRKG